MRVLLDEKLAPVTADLFHEAGIKTDLVKLTAAILHDLLAHGKYAGLVVRDRIEVPLAAMEAAGDSFKIIGIVGDALNNLNVIEATKLGIIVKITEYGNTYEASSLAKRLMILLLSKAFRKRDAQQALILQDPAELANIDCTGFELAEKTVGLVGCGRVAQALAMEISPHCDRVLGYDNNPHAVYQDFHLPNPLERPVIEYCQLSEIAEKADLISIHTSGEDRIYQIEAIFNSDLRPFIVNTTRGTVIGDKELQAALKKGRIRGLATAVPYQELKKGEVPEHVKSLLGFGNVAIAPSLGRPTAEAHKKNAKALAHAVIDYLKEQDLSLAVNPPEVFGGKSRIEYPLSVETHQVTLPLRP